LAGDRPACRRICVLCVQLWFLFPTATTAAQDAQDPGAAFDEGLRALQEERFADALAAFETSYRLDPVPVVLYNIGMCQRELGDPAAARTALLRYAAAPGEGDPPDLREQAERTIREIDALLASLTVNVEPSGATVLIDAIDVGTAPLAEPLRLNPGRHVVDARADGFDPGTVEVDLSAGESATVTMRLAPAAPPTPVGPPPVPVEPPPLPVEPPPAVGSATPPAPPAPVGGGAWTPSGWFWAAAGVASAATLAAVVTGSLALDFWSDYEDGGARDAGLRDSILDLRLSTDVLIGFAAAGAAAGLILFLVEEGGEAPEEAAPPAAVAVGPGGLEVVW
jgi:hypothetical protein